MIRGVCCQTIALHNLLPRRVMGRATHLPPGRLPPGRLRPPGIFALLRLRALALLRLRALALLRLRALALLRLRALALLRLRALALLRPAAPPRPRYSRSLILA